MWTRRILSQEKDNHILPWSIPFLLPYNPSGQYFWNPFVVTNPYTYFLFLQWKADGNCARLSEVLIAIAKYLEWVRGALCYNKSFFCLLIYLTLCLRIFYSLSLFAKWPFRLHPSCRPFVSFFTSRFFKFYCFTIWYTQMPLNAYFCSHAALGVSIGLKYCTLACIKLCTTNFCFI